MADFDELANALSTDAVGIPRDLLIKYPEQFPPDHAFTDSDGTEFTAGELAAANADSTTVDIDGFLVDLGGTRYLPDHDLGGNLFLRIMLDTAAGESPDASGAIALTDAQYRHYLRTVVTALEKVCYFLSLSGRLHKEAVQDAVDTVQSKRLDFLETKQEQVDVAGIVSTVIIAVLVQAGVPGFIFGQLLRQATRLASKPFMRKAMDVVFAFAGKRSGKSAVIPLIKELDADIARLSGQVRTLNDRFLELAPAARNDVEKSKAILAMLQKARAKADAKASAQSQKEILEARLRDELIAIGRTEVDRLKAAFQKKVIDPQRAAAEGKAEEKAVALLKDALVPDPPPDAPVVLPVDVYLKSFIQNFYEEQLQVFERLLALARDLLENLDLRQMSTADDVALHSLALDQFPDSRTLRGLLDDYADMFGADFSYKAAKEFQTREYELLIWSFLLRSKIRLFVDVARARAQTEAATAAMVTGFVGNSTDIFEFMKKPTRYEILDVSPPLGDYLSRRFGFKNDQEVLGRVFKTIVENFDVACEQVNGKLTPENAAAYSAVIISSTRRS